MTQDKKSLGQHIKRIATINVMLFFYFVSTSFSCFVILAVGLFVVATDSPYETFNNLIGNSPGKCSTVDCINTTFDTFRNFTVVEQFLWIFGLKILIEITWYLPTWLIILVGAQIFASWHLLQDFGIIDTIKQISCKGHEQLKKVAEMIPKYKAN